MPNSNQNPNTPSDLHDTPSDSPTSAERRDTDRNQNDRVRVKRNTYQETYGDPFDTTSGNYVDMPHLAFTDDTTDNNHTTNPADEHRLGHGNVRIPNANNANGQPNDSATDSPVESGLGDTIFVEVFRVSTIMLAAVTMFAISASQSFDASISSVFVALGVLAGYVVGGVLGRFISTSRASVEERLEALSSPVLFMALMGLIIGMLSSFAVTIPLLFINLPMVAGAVSFMFVVIGGYFGANIGARRAGDLLRFLGTGGRRPTTASIPRGIEYKLIDTSALIDGRIVELCANGFVEGELLVPAFVVNELQGLADSSDKERRRRGQRGLDVLSDLQHLTTIGVQITSEDPLPLEVDAKLLYLAKKRGTPLFTTDANLARTAEVQNIPVRNINRLADSVRPPVTAGDVLTVRVARRGREENQGVGFLADGSMVVVENGQDMIGEEIDIYVTSLMANNSGRMIFATYTPEDD